MSPTTPAKAGSSTVPFGEVLRLGSTGTQPVAVKRGLWHAGFREDWSSLGDAAIAAEVLGDVAVGNLETFQRYHGLKADGVYGPGTHAVLRGSFDPYAVQLYKAKPKPPPAGTVVVPLTFKTTHDTAGLPGFPAVDVFGKPGSRVIVDFDCTVTRLSGKSPSLGGESGGAYGWSTYLAGPHGLWYVTHQASRTVHVGQRLKKGDVIGTVCDASVAHMPSSDSHVHVGKHDL